MMKKATLRRKGTKKNACVYIQKLISRLCVRSVIRSAAVKKITEKTKPYNALLQTIYVEGYDANLTLGVIRSGGQCETKKKTVLFFDFVRNKA
jgi:hypothetical protein